VIRSNTFDVTRRTEEDRYLHLIAFITHQFYRLHDNLIDVLLTTTQSAINLAQREHKERCYEQRAARGEAVKLLMDQLDKSLQVIKSVDGIAENLKLDDAEKIGEIRSLLRGARETREEVPAFEEEL
jgi:hypothetical protein